METKLPSHLQAIIDNPKNRETILAFDSKLKAEARQAHLEAAQKIEDNLHKLEKGEEIADALAKHDEHLKQAERLVAHYVRMMKD
jgi:hypothetical protein